MCKIGKYSGLGLGITFDGDFFPFPDGEDPTGCNLVQRKGLWFWSRPHDYNEKPTMTEILEGYHTYRIRTDSVVCHAERIISIMDKLTEGLHLGDARILSKRIPDESIDFIFSDPIYEHIEDYLWLARTAERVLKPDRALLVFCSDIKMFTIKTLMDSIKGLTFIKPFYYTVEAKPSCLRGYGIYTWTTPAFLYVKGDGWPKRTGRRCPDTKIEQITTFVSREKPKGKHKWNKNPKVLESWVRAFTDPGETVFDPFTGSAPIPYVCAQLRRKYVAFEIDPSTMEQARERLSVVQQYFKIESSQKSLILGL